MGKNVISSLTPPLHPIRGMDAGLYERRFTGYCDKNDSLRITAGGLSATF
jgi:hypothetical protein